MNDEWKKQKKRQWRVQLEQGFLTGGMGPTIETQKFLCRQALPKSTDPLILRAAAE